MNTYTTRTIEFTSVDGTEIVELLIKNGATITWDEQESPFDGVARFDVDLPKRYFEDGDCSAVQLPDGTEIHCWPEAAHPAGAQIPHLYLGDCPIEYLF